MTDNRLEVNQVLCEQLYLAVVKILAAQVMQQMKEMDGLAAAVTPMGELRNCNQCNLPPPSSNSLAMASC